VGEFKSPLTPMDRSTKQKISKETQTLNDTMDQLDLIDISWTIYRKTMKFTYFSSAHGTLSRIDHILGHKSTLGKVKKIKIIPSIFSDHNAVRLDVNYRRKTIKKYKHMEAK
jgi:exonuclease III